jgi:hypothetical protein
MLTEFKKIKHFDGLHFSPTRLPFSKGEAPYGWELPEACIERLAVSEAEPSRDAGRIFFSIH